MTIFKSITGGSELPQLPTFIPECMTAMELATWEAYNRRCGRNAAVRACADCLLGFAADMRALGKCNGTPGGADEDDPE